jgi:CRP-like cAMP-binding protein
MAQAGTHTIDGEPRFDLAHFLTSAGSGRRIVHCDPKNALFSQGDSADSVFYIQSGRLKVTVVSANGKEAQPATLLGRIRLPQPLNTDWSLSLQSRRRMR